MNLQPLGDRVLIKVEKEQEKTVSGIVLPDTVEKKSKAQGAIVSMGAGDELSKLGLNLGVKLPFWLSFLILEMADSQMDRA